ncbi:MAG: hypothetical protein M1830_001548, partial [Pleopsidium flavum]
MSDSDDDEQLKEAIALSLQDQSFSLREGTPAPSSAAPGSVIDLTHSPPDGAGTYTQHIRYAGTSAVTTSVHTDQPKSSSILGLDRKEMEEQRLARKRKAPISPPPARRERPLNGKKVKVMNVSSRPSSQSEEGGMQYPSGVVKKTWAFGYAREGDIKIEEVLQKTDLQLAVLSAFQWDVEWLLRKIALDETKMIFVMQAKEDAVKRQYERETASMSNLRLCFPSMEGVNCMHSKLMLLSHPTHLRVVVPSANLVPFDWGEDGIMENTVFLIDLPRIARHDGTSRDSMTLFGKELIHFIESMGLQQEVIESIYNFDFSGTKDLAFVHSMFVLPIEFSYLKACEHRQLTPNSGGSHSGEEWRRTGYCGLGRAVQMLGLQYEGPLEIDYVSSSIGSLNGDFLKMIYLAAQGDDGMTEYEWRYNKSDQAKRNGGKNEAEREYEDILMAQIRKTCRIYFPTKETVVN